MVEQLSLLPRARRSDPRTAKDAAARVGVVAPSLERSILDLLGRYSSLTKDEVAEMLGVDARKWPSVSSCLSRMRAAGQVEWTGQVEDGMNKYRLATVTVDTRGRT